MQKEQLNKISLIVKPTDACNLRCKHCYAAETGYTSGRMTIATVRKIYDVFTKEHNEIQIIWHGGEPLLMGIDFFKEAIKMQEEYSKVKFNNSLQSNATLLTEEWIDFFIAHNVKLGISFDGQFNDILRDKTMQVFKAINLMKKKEYKFGCICVISSKTVDKLIDIYEFFKCIGVSYKFNPIFASGEAKKHTILSLSTRKYVDNFLTFFEYWLNDKNCNISVNNNLDYVSQYLGKRQSLCTYTSCLTKWFGIHYNGDIYPCGRAFPEEYNIGNIENFESINEIFLASNYQALLRGAIERRETCKKNCSLYSKCLGGCNNNAIIAGDIRKSNYQECLIFKKLHQPIIDMLRKKIVGDIKDIVDINPTIKSRETKHKETNVNNFI